MKYNTFENYHMTATYRPFELEERVENSGEYYRRYLDEQEVKCKIIVSPVGTPTLYSKTELQPFSLVYNLRDVAGVQFLWEAVYVVRGVKPVFDPMGGIFSYAHPLATATPEITEAPVNPRPNYKDLDQV